MASIDKKNAVFCFGRFQPPTYDHKKLAMRVMKEAQEKNADPWVFSSGSENKNMWRSDKTYRKMKDAEVFCSHRANENPMKYELKLEIIKGLWSDLKGLNIHDSKNTENPIRNVNDIIQFLNKKGYTNLYLVIGEDRFIKGSFDEFYFQNRIQEFIVIPRDEGLISGTKARIAALERFQSAVRFNDTKRIYDFTGLDDEIEKYTINNLGFPEKEWRENQEKYKPFIKNMIQGIWEGLLGNSMVQQRDIYNWVNDWSIPRSNGKCKEIFGKSKPSSIIRFSNRKERPRIRSDIQKVFEKEDSMRVIRANSRKKAASLVPENVDDETLDKDIEMKKQLLGEMRRKRYFADKDAHKAVGQDTRKPGIELTAVMTFGRFQPPHKGHGSLIKQVHDVAKEWSADPFIFTSNSTDYSDDVDERMKKIEKGKTNRNPLSPDEKIYWLRKLYPEYYDSIINKKTYDDIRGWYKNITPYTVCYWLLDQGYTRIILVVGEDRVKSFENLKEEIEYLGHRAVLLFKERNEGAISGTKVRQMAMEEKFDEFKEAVQTIDKNGKEILKEGEIEVLMKLVARKTDSQSDKRSQRRFNWTQMRAALPSIGTKKKGKKDTTGGGRRRKKKTRKKRGGNYVGNVIHLDFIKSNMKDVVEGGYPDFPLIQQYYVYHEENGYLYLQDYPAKIWKEIMLPKSAIGTLVQIQEVQGKHVGGRKKRTRRRRNKYRIRTRKR